MVLVIILLKCVCEKFALEIFCKIFYLLLLIATIYLKPVLKIKHDTTCLKGVNISVNYVHPEKNLCLKSP